MTEDTLVSNKVVRLVDQWGRSLKALDHARSELKKAEDYESITRQELGGLLAPNNAKPGDQFHIWIRFELQKMERLLIVKYEGWSKYALDWWKETTQYETVQKPVEPKRTGQDGVEDANASPETEQGSGQ